MNPDLTQGGPIYGPFISYSQAKAQGLKKYFNGKPCKYGHIDARTIQGKCCTCDSLRHKAKNAIRSQQRIEVACPSCGKIRTRSGNCIGTKEMETSLCRTCAKKAWHKDNPEAAKRPNDGQFQIDLNSSRHRALAAGRDRYQGKACQHGHGHERYSKDGKCVACVAERAAKRGAIWAANNRGKVNATAAKRRFVKALATPSWLTQKDWDAMEAIYIKAAALSAETGTPYEVDHIVPLQGKLACGFHCPENLRIVTRTENRRKSAKFNPFAKPVAA